MGERERIVDETTLRVVAYVIGDASAAAKALAELERRRADGEKNIVVLAMDDMLLVGPDPAIQSVSGGMGRGR